MIIRDGLNGLKTCCASAQDHILPKIEFEELCNGHHSAPASTFRRPNYAKTEPRATELECLATVGFWRRRKRRCLNIDHGLHTVKQCARKFRITSCGVRT